MLKSNYKLKKNTFYLYNKFLGFLTKKGHKIHAQNILSASFIKVSKKTGFSLTKILLYLFLKLNTFVEVKRVRVRKSIY